MAKIVFNNNRFESLSSYEERHVFKERGWRWDVGVRRWVTDDIKKVEDLLDLCDEGALKMYQEISRDLAKKLEESRMLDSSINVPVPDGLFLYGYQKAGVEFINSRGNVLLADEMGLGKTVQVIGYINLNRDIKNVLIITPAQLKLNWERELRRWLVRDFSIKIVKNGKDSLSEEEGNSIIICNYDILKVCDVLKKIDLLVVDEAAHYIKNSKTIRYKNVERLKDKAKKIIILTGTPIMNRPFELFSLLSVLKHPLSRDFWGFVKRYCDAYKDKYGWVFSGASNLDELQEKLRLTVMLRREKREVLKDLPDKIKELIVLNGVEDLEEVKFLEDMQNKIKAIKNDSSSYKEKVEELKGLYRVGFEMLSRLRHQTTKKKIPHIKEFIDSFLETGQKLVIFGHHKDVLMELFESYKDISVVITGDMNVEDRQKSVDRFQNDEKVKLFFGSIRACGVGITLTSASHVLFIEMDWTPAMNEQAEDRCHRIGQKSCVNIYYMVFDGTIDAKIAKIVENKKEVIDEVLDFTNLD